METLAQYLANGTSYTVAKNHTPNVGSSPLSCYSLMVFDLKRTSLGFFEIRLTFFFFSNVQMLDLPVSFYRGKIEAPGS